ncbi:MAG: hypothetical protein F9K09_01345 [Flavobacteriales bacterium]|nr:MAG: hypothetical protein F9K09_01345 [Flavobacteriales bacterium]
MKSKKQQYNIDDFLKEHELKLGEKEDYDIKPSAKYAVLKEALNNYYETFKSGWGDNSKLCHFIIINEVHVSLNSANGHEYIMNCYNSIIHMQMFLELYIVDLLESIHPVLVKGKLNKEIDLLNAITWKFDESDFSNKKTIQFSDVLKRFEFLIDNDEHLPINLKVDKQFHFFKRHIKTIFTILEQRNTMLHRGKGILKDFALDLLWINHIIPLIIDILKLEERIPFLDKNTFCNLNVLKELNSINLDHDYKDISKKDIFIRDLNRICHLKELGRASFKNKLFMGEWGDERVKENFEEIHNKKIRDVAEFKAQLFHTNLNYFNMHKCPCCGCRTLLTHEPWTILAIKRDRLHKAECIYCSYSINVHIGEPNLHGIMDEEIFIYLD